MQWTDSLADTEKGVKNKWVWGWCESPDANGDYLSDYIRKVNLSGAAIRQCNKKISYRNGGKNALKQHAKKQVHINMGWAGQGSQTLPAVFKAAAKKSLAIPVTENTRYDPIFYCCQKKNLTC